MKGETAGPCLNKEIDYSWGAVVHTARINR